MSPAADDKPQNDCGYWLWESQKLLTNVAHWMNSGRTETADKAIRDYWQRWGDAPK